MPKIWFVHGTKKSLHQTAIAKLTDSTGGTRDGTLQAVPASPTDPAPACNNNFSEINAKLDAVIDALKNAGITV